MVFETATPKFTVHGDDNSVREVCWVFTAARFHRPLATFFALLRPGDEIRPVFVANNTSPALRGAGVMVDEIAVEIIRPRRSGTPQVFHLALDTQVWVVAPPTPVPSRTPSSPW